MTLDSPALAFAGCVVPLSAALARFASPWRWLLTPFARANMLQASFAGVWPAAMTFKALGVREGVCFG